MAYTRNPSPAQGPGVYSLDELRHYCRLFWRERRYGVCHVQGGQKAFTRACGYADRSSFEDTLIADPPRSEFLASKRQRVISRIVRLVLSGKLHFETSPTNVARAIARFNNEGLPLVDQPPPARIIRFKLDGARVRRVP